MGAGRVSTPITAESLNARLGPLRTWQWGILAAGGMAIASMFRRPGEDYTGPDESAAGDVPDAMPTADTLQSLFDTLPAVSGPSTSPVYIEAPEESGSSADPETNEEWIRRAAATAKNQTVALVVLRRWMNGAALTAPEARQVEAIVDAVGLPPTAPRSSRRLPTGGHTRTPTVPTTRPQRPRRPPAQIPERPRPWPRPRSHRRPPTPSYPPAFRRALRKGAPKSLAAAWLQIELNHAGAGLTVDGIYGARTAAAVATYKRTHGIPGNGSMLGAAAWRALKRAQYDRTGSYE